MELIPKEEVVNLACSFYQLYQTPLSMRSFVLFVKKTYPTFSSITMIELFGESEPLVCLCDLASLPSPLGCR